LDSIKIVNYYDDQKVKSLIVEQNWITSKIKHQEKLKVYWALGKNKRYGKSVRKREKSKEWAELSGIETWRRNKDKNHLNHVIEIKNKEKFYSSSRDGKYFWKRTILIIAWKANSIKSRANSSSRFTCWIRVKSSFFKKRLKRNTSIWYKQPVPTRSFYRRREKFVINKRDWRDSKS